MKHPRKKKTQSKVWYVNSVFDSAIFKISFCERTEKNIPPSVSFQDISLQYQIFPDEVLGSGQFGIVYGGTDSCSSLLAYIQA